MARYLVHYSVSGEPLGVWNGVKESFYGPQVSKRHKEYGQAVLEGADFENHWEDILETWDGRTPNTRARWSVIRHPSEDLEEVFIFLVRTSDT